MPPSSYAEIQKDKEKNPTLREKCKSIWDCLVAQLTEHACSAPFSPLEVTEWGEKESERRKKAMGEQLDPLQLCERKKFRTDPSWTLWHVPKNMCDTKELNQIKISPSPLHPRGLSVAKHNQVASARRPAVQFLPDQWIYHAHTGVQWGPRATETEGWAASRKGKIRKWMYSYSPLLATWPGLNSC